jgi:hypothetical protein
MALGGGLQEERPMSLAVISRHRATAAPAQATMPAARTDEEHRISGFRIEVVSPSPRLTDAARPWRPIAVGGRGDNLPLIVGFVAAPGAASREAVMSMDADALPIDGTWRWLGMLSCWLSTALVAAAVIMALN